MSGKDTDANPPCCRTAPISTSLCALGYGKGRRSTWSMTENMAAFTPMPSARVRIAVSVKPGVFANCRSAYFTSFQKMMAIRPRKECHHTNTTNAELCPLTRVEKLSRKSGRGSYIARRPEMQILHRSLPVRPGHWYAKDE